MLRAMRARHSRRTRFVQMQMRCFADLPPYTEVPMPALSPTMETGVIGKWLLGEGDAIGAGDLMAEIETDKATVDYEATDDAFMAKILIPEGADDIPVGQTIAITVDDSDDIAAFASFTAADLGGAAPEAAAAPAAVASPVAPAATQQPVAAVAAVPIAAVAVAAGERVFASPLARKILRESGVAVDLAAIGGSGPGGRVLQDDVLAAIANAQAVAAAPQAAQPAAQQAVAVGGSGAVDYSGDSGGRYTDASASRIRQIIAKSTTASKQNVPHYYMTVELCIDELMAMRAKLNEGNTETKLSVNDFLVKAAALACKAVPEVNSSWLPAENAIRTYDYVDVNVGMATDKGLISPVIRDADTAGLAAISARVRSLANGAKEGSLTPADHDAGTFTISNLGMFGIKQFTAIVSEPQACILAVGAAEDRVVVAKTAEAATADGDHSQFRVEKRMNVTLSCDHRVVDGAVGAQWLQVFKKLLEDPITMLL